MAGQFVAPLLVALLAASLTGALASTTSQRPAGAQPPFIVAPTIVGMMVCEEAGNDPRITSYEAAVERCRRLGRNGAAAVRRLLDTLEPGGARGQVQVGFTATLQLLTLYRKTGKGWEIDATLADEFLRVLTDVDRPAVVYLAANHFDAIGPLTRELQQNPANLLQLPGGRPLELEYFGHRIAPYTLQSDADLPINRYRYEALRYMARRIASLPQAVRERIVAITLAGELHHLFPDFAGGMGAHEGVQATDYSAASVAGFRNYLAHQYGTVEAFNQRTGLSYAAFDAISAPSKDVRQDSSASPGEHYDAFAGGTLPLSGWLWDPDGLVDELDLYLNARYVGPIAWGFNRLDVYRAVETVQTPNVGFRLDFDYTALPPGRHLAQIVARAGNTRYRVAQAEFTVLPRDPRARVPSRRPPAVFGMEDIGALPPVRAWLDLPTPQQSVYFNPLARDWDRYREQQVADLLGTFHELAVAEGLPRGKLYSHQIVPDANSSWNPQLFAAGQTLQGSAPWKHGLNMYGGAVDSPWMRQFLSERGIQDYGIPEFHPQQWKRDGVALAAMQSHLAGGARFISPYYFSVIPKRFKSQAETGISRMELRPDNPADGSDRFYRAIIEFAKR